MNRKQVTGNIPQKAQRILVISLMMSIDMADIDSTFVVAIVAAHLTPTKQSTVRLNNQVNANEIKQQHPKNIETRVNLLTQTTIN
jgi:hypothetical protein